MADSTSGGSVSNKRSVSNFESEAEYTLPEQVLYLREKWKGKHRALVPPPTPTSDFCFEYNFEGLPSKFPDISKFKIPLVRQEGVKECIRMLGDYFGCKDYKFSLLQYWFLDMVTDCLWKVQDEFRFPESLQQTVISWILYIIDAIRDPHKNFNRKQLFNFFKESVLLAAEVIDEGCKTLPLPDQLLSELPIPENNRSSDGNSSSSNSSMTLHSSEIEAESCIQFNIKNKPNFYVLEKEPCFCRKYNLSSISSLSEATVPSDTQDLEMESMLQEEQSCVFDTSSDDIPSRFLPLEDEEESSAAEQKDSDSETFLCDGEENKGFETGQEGVPLVEEISDAFEIRSVLEYSTPASSSCSGKLQPPQIDIPSDYYMSKVKVLESTLEVDGGKDKKKTLFYEDKLEPIKGGDKSRKSLLQFQQKTVEEEVLPPLPTQPNPPDMKEKDILKYLYNIKLYEKRLEDMADPNIGRVPSEPKLQPEPVETPAVQDEGSLDESEWIDIVEMEEPEIRNMEENALINFGVLWAVIDFIFEYFYESFQFTLIKLALQACPNIITQNVNEEWNVPKMPKAEFKKPPEKQIKKEKPPRKEKKPKKDKSAKVSEKGKKGKKGKTSDKASKNKKGKKAKEKQKKDKSSKASKKGAKKGKKETEPKLTKEEKEELERKQKEEEEKLQALKTEQENRLFMFPLTDAADDSLFKNIFPKWVKVETKTDTEGKEKGKKKKGKKGKKEKKK